MPGPSIILPQAGDEVTAAWGQSVAGALNGIQAGVVSITKPTGVNTPGQVAVVFPKPYASAPVVVANVANTSGAGLIAAGASLVTATGFTAWLSRIDAAGGTTTQPVHWVAIGTLA